MTQIQPLKKILVVKLRSLGDSILWSASLRKLRESYPKAEIHAVIPEPWMELTEAMPWVDRWISHRVYSDKASRARALIGLIFRLRNENYDGFIGFHASPSVAMIGLASRAKVRAIHFHGHTDPNRHSTVEIPGKGVVKPIIERDLDCLRALGISIPENSVFPELRLPTQWTNEWKIPSIVAKGPRLWIALGASRPTKHWPIDRFYNVAKRWITEKDGVVFLSRGPDESHLESEWRRHMVGQDFEYRMIWVPSRSLKAVAAWMSHCQIFLGNDSGPKHLAVALGVPTVTVFGPEDPFEWHPYNTEKHKICYIPNLPCRKDALPGFPQWCGLHECTHEKNRCMTDITVDQVFQELKKIL
jgi:heptosyltransferase-2